MKHYFIVILLVVSFTCLSQQSESLNYFIDFSGISGLTVPNLKAKKFFIDTRFNGVDFYIGLRKKDSTIWVNKFRYPDYGVGFQINIIDERNILGNAYSIYYTINLPFYPVRKIGVFYSISIGTSFISNPFHPEINYLNMANGSRMNVFAHFGLKTRIQVYNNIKFKLGFNFYHISNGNIKQPNDGLNLLAFESGISLSLENRSKLLVESHSFNQENQIFYITNSVGTKQTRILGDRYFMYALNFDSYLYSTSKRSLGVGIDFIYDNSINYLFESDSSYLNKEKRFIYNGIYLTHALNLNRVSILTNVGYYIDYYHIMKDEWFYYLGLRYFVTHHLFGNFGIKARFNGGDFIAWGIGYAL